ncbi:hypothetical protein EVAR_38830_1 [Eumeta japonica]|uniref:Uncharacterized protein n=1 Tax=Eumeta variegata TaxID=151549 RepID=A0A4C1XNU1_EUMVA|nr:hypothetical protein EVAR_38830_1 [Eumeta japonica]
MILESSERDERRSYGKSRMHDSGNIWLKREIVSRCPNCCEGFRFFERVPEEFDGIFGEDGNDSSDCEPSENSSDGEDKVVSVPEVDAESEDHDDDSQATTSNANNNLWTEIQQNPELFIFQENVGVKLNTTNAEKRVISIQLVKKSQPLVWKMHISLPVKILSTAVFRFRRIPCQRGHVCTLRYSCSSVSSGTRLEQSCADEVDPASCAIIVNGYAMYGVHRYCKRNLHQPCFRTNTTSEESTKCDNAPVAPLVSWTISGSGRSFIIGHFRLTHIRKNANTQRIPYGGKHHTNLGSILKGSVTSSTIHLAAAQAHSEANHKIEPTQLDPTPTSPALRTSCDIAHIARTHHPSYNKNQKTPNRCTRTRPHIAAALGARGLQRSIHNVHRSYLPYSCTPKIMPILLFKRIYTPVVRRRKRWCAHKCMQEWRDVVAKRQDAVDTYSVYGDLLLTAVQTFRRKH